MSDRNFTPVNGGLGALLSCTSSSSRVALPNPTLGSIWQINNIGTDFVSLAFGNSSVEATTSYITFGPGISQMGIPNAGGSGAPTHMAGITSGTTVLVQITAGILS
jgi:hypothetical protein